MRPIIHRLIALLTLVVFLLVQKPLPSQAAGMQARPATWTHCTVHLKLDFSGVQRYDCRTFAMPREHRTPLRHVTWQHFLSPHVVSLTKWPVFYTAPPPVPTLDGFPPLVARWAGYVYEAANRSGIPARIIAGTIMQESSGLPYVTSQGFDSADIGLMQYGVAEAVSAYQTCGIGVYTFDPRLNIITGSCFLAWTLTHCAGGNLYAAVAKYNGGCYGGNYGYAASVYRWAGMSA